MVDNTQQTQNIPTAEDLFLKLANLLKTHVEYEYLRNEENEHFEYALQQIRNHVSFYVKAALQAAFIETGNGGVLTAYPETNIQ